MMPSGLSTDRLPVTGAEISTVRPRNEEAPARRLGYRPELDGLRAIAVAIVLLFHFHVGFRDGGYTGVTIFFVLSGYLITRLLVAEHAQTGRIDLRGFYARRVRRLLPALAVMLVAVTAGALVTGTFDRMLAPILSAAFYVANIAQKRIEMGQLDHTWTLAVEEHFYLVWPALLVLTRFRAARWWIPAAASVVMMYIGLDGYWAITAGCALGLAKTPRVSWVVAAAGIFAIALSLAGPKTAVPGALLVLLYLEHNQSRVLASRPFVAVGKISYGIYLWQYPVIFATETWIHPTWVWAIVVVVTTLGIAYLSARFVEARFRHSSSMTPPIESRSLVASVGA